MQAKGLILRYSVVAAVIANYVEDSPENMFVVHRDVACVCLCVE
jgi:hypothetical protein